jgi:hypothetical protein
VLQKLSSACYVIRRVTPLMAEETLRAVYFAYAQSVLSHGIILWGNPPHNLIVFKMENEYFIL